jgi:predicted AAA+ superfamily ATPase
MIKRRLLPELKAHLDEKEISLIIGPRQAGKTTLMLLLKDFLQTQGKKCLFLNLDIEADRKFFDSQESLVNKIVLEVGDTKAFVFIDEIQRKEDAGLFLKGIYDMNLPYKFIVSGSGSVELKEKVHESLAGRKRLFELYTLSFEEFANYKTGYKYEEKLQDFFKLENEKALQLLQEYINFGGYPRVVLEKTFEEKRKIISDLYQSYLERDISHLLGVQKTEDFTSLLKIIASHYLWYMEKTYIIYKITPFFKNIRKEITKSPVLYFHDLGLRNYALGIFGNVVETQDTGFLFQNFVSNILCENITYSSSQIHFWRTKDRAEVDFVLTTGVANLPIEVKYKALKSPEVSKSLHSFLAKYKPKEAYLVHLGTTGEVFVGDTKVKMLPFYNVATIKS